MHQQRQPERQRCIPRSPTHDRPRSNYTQGHGKQRHSQETFWNTSEKRDPIRESIDSPTDEILPDAYNLETIDPRDRWEQEQLYEFEGSVILEHLQLLRDQIEQQGMISTPKNDSNKPGRKSKTNRFSPPSDESSTIV